jgi:hypothetical protein
MNDFGRPRAGNSPELGYLSRDQLIEYAQAEGISPSESASKGTASLLWNRIHMYSLNLNLFSNSPTAESVTVVAHDQEFGELVNLSVLAGSIETGELQKLPKIGKKAVELAQLYIEDRRKLLGIMG